MSDTLCLTLLLAVNAWLIAVFALRIRPREGWASPITFWLPFYVLNYPLRAVILSATNGTSVEQDVLFYDYAFLPGEIVAALAYSTLFAVILLGVYASLPRLPELCRKGTALSGGQSQPQEECFTLFLGAFFLVNAVAFGFQVATGNAFSLYTSLEDLKRPFLVNLLLQMRSLKWLLLAYAFLRVQRSRSVLGLVLTFSCLFIEVCGAIISTAKGGLLAIALLWAVSAGIVRQRLPYATLAGVAVLAASFAFFSQAVRQHGSVGDRSAPVLLTAHENMLVAGNVLNGGGSAWEKRLMRIGSRLSYLDAIMLIQRQQPYVADGPYTFGSIVELGNVVPRILWPNRPHLSFNHEMTHAVWGMSRHHFLEMPIGRIGESAFMLGWAGLMLAPLYAVLWHWLYTRFYLAARDDRELAIYLGLLCLIVLPDAYLLYNMKAICVMAFAAIVLRMEDKAQSRPPQGVPSRSPIGKVEPGPAARLVSSPLEQLWRGGRP